MRSAELRIEQRDVRFARARAIVAASSAWEQIVLAALITAALSVVDYSTGSEISFSISSCAGNCSARGAAIARQAPGRAPPAIAR